MKGKKIKHCDACGHDHVIPRWRPRDKDLRERVVWKCARCKKIQIVWLE